jgi:hypothetical protein
MMVLCIFHEIELFLENTRSIDIFMNISVNSKLFLLVHYFSFFSSSSNVNSSSSSNRYR